MITKDEIRRWYDRMWDSGYDKETIRREFYINFHENDVSDIAEFMDPYLSKKKHILIILLFCLSIAFYGDMLVALIMKATIFSAPLEAAFRTPTLMMLFLAGFGARKVSMRSSKGFSMISLSALIMLLDLLVRHFYPPLSDSGFLMVDFVMLNSLAVPVIAFIISFLALHLKLATNHDAKIFGYSGSSG